MFTSVMSHQTVFAHNTQGIVYAVFCSRWEIGFISKFFLADGLDCQILCGNDAQTAAVKRAVCLVIGISFFFCQYFQYLIDQGIFIIRIDIGLFVGGIIFQNPVVNRIFQCIFLLLWCDISLRLHIRQDGSTSAVVFFRVPDRVESSRILRNSSQNGRF